MIVNDKLERLWKATFVAYLKALFQRFMGGRGLRETTKKLVSWSFGRESNPESPEYNVGVPATQRDILLYRNL